VSFTFLFNWFSLWDWMFKKDWCSQVHVLFHSWSFEMHVANTRCKLHCKENAVKLYSEIFINDFLTIIPPIKEIPFFNVLCFGIAGSGKSSFISSVLTSLKWQCHQSCCCWWLYGPLILPVPNVKLKVLKIFRLIFLIFGDWIYTISKTNCCSLMFCKEIFLKIMLCENVTINCKSYHRW